MDIIDFNICDIEILHKTIGLNVANLRKKCGVSQLELSLSIGYNSTSVIAKGEAGTENKHFSIEQLYKIAVALNVDISELFYGISTKTDSLK